MSRISSVRIATFAVATVALASASFAQIARRAPRVYNDAPYGDSAGQGRSVNSPGSVYIDNSHPVPTCNTTREQVPAAGGGLIWQLRTDCNRDPY